VAAMRVRPALRDLAVRAWARWTVVARIIGTFQARVVLTLFYFVIVPPFALIATLVGDPLRLKSPAGTGYWTERRPEKPSLEAARRQY
jgi:hypothetical protein